MGSLTFEFRPTSVLAVQTVQFYNKKQFEAEVAKIS